MGRPVKGSACESRRLCYTPIWMYCLGVSTLAFVSVCIGRDWQNLKTCIKLGHLDVSLTHPLSLCRLRLPAALGDLGVDSRYAHAFALTPRAGDRALRAAEVGDHAARAAAGHTLPRSMRPIDSIAVFVAVLARHAGLEISVLLGV